jgi:hypothetical protein
MSQTLHIHMQEFNVILHLTVKRLNGYNHLQECQIFVPQNVLSFDDSCQVRISTNVLRCNRKNTTHG